MLDRDDAEQLTKSHVQQNECDSSLTMSFVKIVSKTRRGRVVLDIAWHESRNKFDHEISSIDNIVELSVNFSISCRIHSMF
jgi:hypothetical protein